MADKEQYESDLRHKGDQTKLKTMAGFGWEWKDTGSGQGYYYPRETSGNPAKKKFKQLYGYYWDGKKPPATPKAGAVSKPIITPTAQKEGGALTPTDLGHKGSAVNQKAMKAKGMQWADGHGWIDTSPKALQQGGGARQKAGLKALGYNWSEDGGYSKQEAGGEVGGGRPPGTENMSDIEFELYTTIKDQLEDLVEQGNQPLPDIEITPEMTAEFLQQATTEMDQHFQRLAGEAGQDLRTNVDRYLQVQQQNEEAYVRDYQDAFGQVGEAAAEIGLTYSGKRQKREREMAEQGQRDITQGREAARHELGGAITGAERYLGSGRVGEALEGVQMPWAGQPTGAAVYDQGVPSPQQPISPFQDTTPFGQPLPLGGQGMFTPGSRDVSLGFGSEPLYSLTPGVEGQLDRDKIVATQTRASELEAAERARRMLLLQ